MRDSLFFTKLRVFLGQWRRRAHRRASWMKARLRHLRRRARRLASAPRHVLSQPSALRPQHSYASRFVLEPLENRLLLAADLTGVVQSATLLDPAVPGSGASAVVQVQNIGNQTVNQSQVGVYASLDTKLDGKDILLGTALTNTTRGTAGQLFPGQSRNIEVNLSIPSTLDPTAYRLLAKVDNANQITENSEANNVAIGGTINVKWQFGNVPGRTGTTQLTLRDADGTDVTFRLSSSNLPGAPPQVGLGEVIRDGSKWDIKVTGTSQYSDLTISTTRTGSSNLGVTLNDVHVSGPLHTFGAPTAILSGTLAIDGRVLNIVLGGVQGGTVAVPSVNNLVIEGNVKNGNFYIGTTLGQDGQLGGTGADADFYGPGSIGQFLVTFNVELNIRNPSVTGTTIRVGVDPVDGIYGNGNDQLLGGTSSAIGGISIIGNRSALSDDSRFYAGKFPTQYLDGRTLKPTAGDPHFTTLVSGGPTTLSAALQQDTGSSTSDRLTSNPTIVGNLADADGIATFVAGFGATPTFNILSDRQANGSFTLSRARLEQINGAPLTDGPYTLTLRATDTGGNATQTTVPFTLDTQIPVLTFDLDAASDPAPVGDHQTTNATVTLIGQTEALASVLLVETGATTRADATGNFNFINVPLAFGANPVTVRATDTAGNQRTEAKMITRVATNQPPVLDPIGNQTVNEGTELTFTATANDPDSGQTLTFSLANGTNGLMPEGASINATTGVFTWTPTELQGPATYTFDVVVKDNGTEALSARETITITVNEVNQAPTLNVIGNQTVNESELLSFTVTAEDQDGPTPTPFTFSLEHGANGLVPLGASITGRGEFAWKPTEAQGPGTYTFDVVVTDNGTPALSDRETITITVNEINQAPTLVPPGNRGIDEKQLDQFLLLATDPDAEDTLTFSLEDGASGAVPTGASIETIHDGSFTTGRFSWTPTEAQGPGTYTFDVVVSDGRASARETITVIVNEVNQAPVLNVIGNQTVNKGQLLTFTATAGDADIPIQDLRFSLLPMGGDVPAGATINPTTGEFTWTPSEEQSPGTFTFAVNVIDTGSPQLSDHEIITVTVNDVNQPPVAGAQMVTTSEDTAVPIVLMGSDGDNDSLTYTIVDEPTHGTLIGTGATRTYTPNPNYTGPDSITFTANDGQLDSNVATVTIEVTPVNDAPTITSNSGSATATISVPENTTAVTTVTAADPDSDALTFSLAGGADQSKFDINAATGVLTFKVASDFESPTDSDADNVYQVVVQVGDEVGEVDTQTLAITVTTANEVPVAVDDTYAFAGGALTVGVPGVLANDTDPDGDSLRAIVSSLPAHGFLNSFDGGFTYIVKESFTGTDSFTYQVVDGEGLGSNMATVTITNPAWVIASDDTYALVAGSLAVLEPGVLFNDNDTNLSGGAGPPEVALFSPPTHGDLRLRAGGGFNYTAGEGFPGIDSFTYVVTDGGVLASNRATVTIIGQVPTNAAPVITSNGGSATATISVPENTTAVTTVTATDPDGDALTFSLAGGADQSHFAIDETTGVLTFTTAQDFESPTDSDGDNIYEVVVQVSDGVGGVNTQTLAVTVTDVLVSTARWINPDGGDWNIASNWDANRVPGLDDDVTIDLAVSNPITFGAGTLQVKSLTMSEGQLVVSGNTQLDALTVSGGTVTFDGSATITTLNQSGGAVNGSGAITLTGTGADASTWSGGTTGGTGQTLLHGELNITAGASELILARQLINSGLVDIQNGTLRLMGGSLTQDGNFHVASGATLDFNVGPVHEFTGNGGISGSGTVVVEGGFVKSGAGTTTTVTPTINIFGGVTAQSGTLVFTGTVTNHHQLTAEAGATLAISGNLTNAETHTLTGGQVNAATFTIRGILRVANADIVTNAATIVLDGPSAQFLNHTTGANALVNLTTNDRYSFTLTNGATFTTVGSLTNTGLLTVGPGSSLTVAGSFTNSLGGLRVSIAGTTISQFGQLVITDTANLVFGSLEVQFVEGFIPTVGDRFRFMNFDSRTGAFTGTTVPTGAILDESNPKYLELVVSAFVPIAPNSAPQGQADLDVAVVSVSANFDQQFTTVDFGPGVIVNSIAVMDATHLIANISIDAGASPGPRTVTIDTNGEIVSFVDGFTVTA